MTELNLDKALATLAAEAKSYPGTLATFLPDFVLYGFATDVREHGEAVQILSSSPVPRASFANARAALESAIDAAYLTSDAAMYDYRGAQARVAELFENEAIEKRAAPLKAPLFPSAPLAVHVEDAVASDAQEWDKQAAGKGDILRRAWEAHTKDPGAVRKHWSLLTKDEVFEYAFPESDAAVLGNMTSVIHSLLSMATHPRPRVGTRAIDFQEGGRIVLGTKPTDPEMARQIAALSCMIAANALQKRRGFTTVARLTSA